MGWFARWIGNAALTLISMRRVTAVDGGAFGSTTFFLRDYFAVCRMKPKATRVIRAARII